MEKTIVLFNGKEHDTDKVISLSRQGVRSSIKLDEYSKVEGIDTAPTSDKVRHLIVTPFEGKSIALVKPVDLEKQVASGKVKICFYSKFLMKKLTATDFVIDTSPVPFSHHEDRAQQERRQPEEYGDYDHRNPRTRQSQNVTSKVRANPVSGATKNALQALMKNSEVPQAQNNRSGYIEKSYTYSR